MSTLKRILGLSLGFGLLVIGLLMPVPSYLEKQSLRRDFDRQIAEPQRKIRVFLAGLAPGEIQRDHRAVRLNQLKQEEAKVRNKLGPAVNASIDQYQQLRLAGWCIALVGLCIVGLTYSLTARPTGSMLDHIPVDFSTAEPDLVTADTTEYA